MEHSACTSGPNTNGTMRSATIDDLPREMLWEVFSYLDFKDLVSACCVSSRWKDVGNGVPLMTNHVCSITLDEDPSEINRIFQSIPNVRNVKILHPCIKNVEFTLRSLLQFCTDIRDLDIRVDKKIDAILLQKVVKKFPNLKSLTFTLWPYSQQLIKQIGACLELQELVLFNRDVDADLKPIADGCPNLRHLRIRSISLKSDEYIYLLKRKKHLLQSFAYTPSRLSPYMVPPLSECTRLEHVGIAPNEHPLGEFVDEIASLSALKRLHLGFIGTIGKNEAVKLSKCSFSSTLTTLHLHVSHGVTQDFSRIIVPGLPNVEELRVWVKYTNEIEGLQNLLEMKKLKHLEISRWPLRGPLFETLLQSKKIKHLVMDRCHALNDKEALRLVTEMKPTYLKITNCFSITNGFLVSFPRCETLRELHVDLKEPLEQSVRELKLRQPTTRIIVHKRKGNFNPNLVPFQ